MDIVSHGFNIYHDLVIKASLQEVFNAISKPEQLNSWWTEKCTGKPELNAEYNLYFTPEYDWYGKVITCQPNQAFHIKMTKSDADWNSTTFGFNLEELNEGVQVRFFHIDWPECNHHFRHSSFLLGIITKRIEKLFRKTDYYSF